MYDLDFKLDFNLDRETNNFIHTRIRNMLGQKVHVDEKYRKYNNNEAELMRKIMPAIPEEIRDLLDRYRNAVIDRETQSLIYAYLLGLKDGMNYTKVIEQFTEEA